MEKYLSVLKKCPLFQNISDNELVTLLNCMGATVEDYEKKDTIVSEGAPAKNIGIIISGVAQTERLDYFGNRTIVSGAKQGGLICESFACAEVENLPVSVVASEPCRVMLLSSEHILHTCSNNCRFHQQLIYNLMKDLATENLLFHQKIEITSKRTTRDKLLAYLVAQAKSAGSNEFTIDFDRQALADYLEVDRSGLSSEIGKLRKEGVLKCTKNRFVLLTDL